MVFQVLFEAWCFTHLYARSLKKERIFTTTINEEKGYERISTCTAGEVLRNDEHEDVDEYSALRVPAIRTADTIDPRQ